MTKKMAGKYMNKAFISLLGLGFLLLVQTGASTSAWAQLSDKAVAKIMSNAWQIMPKEIKDEKGKVIPLDRSNPKKILIPGADAKRIIQIARLSANAQICDLRDLQVQNYRHLMKSEIASKKWTREQIVFINQLHLFTVMLMLGNVTVQVEGEKPKQSKKPSCSPADAARVAELIKARIGKK